MSKRRRPRYDIVESGPFVDWLERWRRHRDSERYSTTTSHVAGRYTPQQFASDTYGGSENSRQMATLEDLAELAGVSVRTLSRAKTTGRISIAVIDRVLIAAGADTYLVDLYPDLYEEDDDVGANGRAEHLSKMFRRHGISPRDFDKRIIELRKTGLSITAIVKVVRYYEGWFVTEHQIRDRLHRLGAPKNPKRQRAGREIARRAA